MYARKTADGRAVRNPKVPPNYGGSAFLSVADTHRAAPEELCEAEEADNAAEAAKSLSQGAQTYERGDGQRTGLLRLFSGSGGLGLEELLILGLALLISQNDAGDDLAILLLLLVFIK